ncbi:integrase [Denitratisoma sp. DHT3]|uniref:site-specific integrase n=1 Tax=Denitratisoma sp. DHT3 TaxID=1981880 RepID=UPI00119877E1|nr:site-specific integrase [Denitratisoma sp. DHT3]QDX82073.1 integrase [Denitratisoma sp. DHT3]
MAQLRLTPSIVNGMVCPPGKKKLDLFDVQAKGLVLEVRKSGGKTYYLRYQDCRSKTRQMRLADARDITLSQARTLADKARNRIALGDDPAEQKTRLRQTPTLGDFFYERYLPFAKSYKKTWGCDESLFRNHVALRLGRRHLDEITKTDIAALHHGRRAVGAAKGSANRLLVMLRYVFNLALRWETPGIAVNPTAGVALFEDPPMKERFLTPEEARRLCAAVEGSPNPMLRFIVPMLILTGARRREVLDLRWEDLDLERRQWRIPLTKAGKPRHVPLSSGVLQVLAAVPRLEDCPWVFPSPKTGRPFVSVFYSWDSARRKAGLADVRIHDLRHSFASFLVNAGRSLYEVQKILGHTQVRTTQRYAHLAQETLLDACDAVVDSLGVGFCPVNPSSAEGRAAA